MNTERDNWKDLTPEDATDDELRLIHRICGPKPIWMDEANWRSNMRACVRDIREHVDKMNGKLTPSIAKPERPNLKVIFLDIDGVLSVFGSRGLCGTRLENCGRARANPPPSINPWNALQREPVLTQRSSTDTANPGCGKYDR